MTKRSDVEKFIHGNAVKMFCDHKLAYSDPIGGRWFIQQQGRDVFSTEVICLRGGRLFVGGGIADCIFAYFSPLSLTAFQGVPRELIARVAWIANNQLDYVVLKAVAGFGGDSGPFYTWDRDVAESDIRDLLKTLKSEKAPFSFVETVSDLFESKQFDEETVMTTLRPWYNSFELSHTLGRHVSARVIYARAATQKLLELIPRE